MNSPSVLVVMPVYNSKIYLVDAINSILQQTYSDFIFLIINDGSTDGSSELIETFFDHRIKLLNQENHGPAFCMNIAINFALENSIPFIARMDSDDISLPTRLEKQIYLLETNKEIAACSCNCFYISVSEGKNLGASTVSISPNLIRWEIKHGLRGLIQGSCTFRTESLYKIGGYNTSFPYAEETDLFLRLSAEFPLTNSPDFLYKIRMRETSLSMNHPYNNVLRHFFAMDSFRRREIGMATLNYDYFSANLNLGMKFKIWREMSVLYLWRAGVSKSNFMYKIIAGLIDPRRAVIRIMRKFLP
ncbi:MAG: hypothetical protein BGO78_15850 [Chloroflexi bacterium 44-23]|nr:MAG: hypothetical protein BGO78_15850 [Chloroflexi bacterium 44-23]